MSRIGRMPVVIPAGVTVDIAEGNKVTVGLCQCHAYRESSCILIISCIILSVKFCFFCYIIVAVLILLYLDRRNQLPQCLLAGLCDTCSGRPSERSVLGISSVL